MQYLGDRLCLEFNEFVPQLTKTDNYHKLRQRGNITVHGTGGNGRQVYIEYETLPTKYKQEVRKLYGDPYAYASKQPILASIHPDPAAAEFFNSYVLPNGDKLPNSSHDIWGKPQINYVQRYTQNAEWLNMIIRLTEDKRALKRELNISIMDFWQTVAAMMKVHEVHLPKTRRRLTAAIKNYQCNGYKVLVVDKDLYDGANVLIEEVTRIVKLPNDES